MEIQLTFDYSHFIPYIIFALTLIVCHEWIICSIRRGGSGVLSSGHSDAGVPGVGARADPMRPLHSGEAERVSGGGSRLCRGVTGTGLRMLDRKSVV